MYRSRDGGRSWETSPLFGNNGLAYLGVQTIAVCPSGQVFAGTWGGGVYRAEAASWKPVNGGNDDLYTTALNCDSLGRLFVGTASTGVFRSVNAGDSWSAVNAGLTNQTILTIRSLDTKVFVGTGDGAFNSTDGGNSWNASALQGQRVFDFEFDPTNPQRVWAATTTAGVFTSWDGGATWSPVGAPLEAYSVARDVDGKLYAGTRSNGVYRFIGGQWVSQQMAAARVYYLRSFGNLRPRIVAGTNDGIWAPPMPQVHVSLRNDPRTMVSNGAQLTYYFDYWGDGVGIVSNVNVTNIIPAGTVLILGSITPADNSSVTGRQVSWHFDSLDPDTHRGTLSYRVQTCVAISAQVTPSGAGSISLPPPNCPGSNRYIPGVALEIATSINSGHIFRNWTATPGNFGDANLTHTTFIPGNADTILTAQFDAWTPTPTNTPTETPTETPTSTPTETPTSTPTETPTSTITPTPTDTPVEAPTNTPTPTRTPTPSRTPFQPPFITRTATPTETPAPTATPTETLVPLDARSGRLSAPAGMPPLPADQTQRTLAQEGMLGAMAVMSASPVINNGATVTWQYGGIQYNAISNSTVNGLWIFLPIILR